MELILLVVSICCMVWGIYNYSEVQKIESLADKCGLSISEYVRKRALGYEPKTVLPDVFFDFYETERNKNLSKER